jgi:hypothetical protein
MHTRKRLLLGLGMLLIGIAIAVWLWPSPTPIDPQERGAAGTLKTLKDADPVKDADSAVAAKDYRLVAVSQFVPIIPGTPRPIFERFKKGLCAYRVIPFTSDAGGNDTWRLNEAAKKYAERYNQRLAEHLSPEEICPSLAWTLEIKVWGWPGPDEFLLLMKCDGSVNARRESLPITKKGPTTVERKLTIPADQIMHIRMMAEHAVKQVDIISVQSRVADGTNVSIGLTYGSVQIGTVLLGLTEMKDSGPEIYSLIKEINSFLPDTLYIE